MRFTPSAVGSRGATLTVAHDGLRSPVTVPLSGEGTGPQQAPRASADPASVGFGPQRLRVPSPARTVVVSNSGSAPLTVGTTTLTGHDPGDFEKSFDTCTGAVVPVGASCRVDVSFLPQSVGDLSATLQVPSDDPSTPLEAHAGHRVGGVAAVPADRGRGNRSGDPGNGGVRSPYGHHGHRRTPTGGTFTVRPVSSDSFPRVLLHRRDSNMMPTPASEQPHPVMCG